MWKVDVKKMCRKHLLGEHVEMHMFFGTIKAKKSLKGYLEKGLVETQHIYKRHEELANELVRRGYNHKSNMEKFNIEPKGKINVEENIKELHRRCHSCLF